MKYKKKFIICNLLGGLIALTFSCAKPRSLIELIDTIELNFPSASATEFYRNQLYLFGDDATYLLVLSDTYKPIDSIRYWDGDIHPIPKKTKPDIESSFIIEKNGQPTLIGIGSMSDINRWKVITYNIATASIDTSSYFLPEKKIAGIEQINIEGSTVVNDVIVLANRANLSSPVNHLILVKENRLTTKKLNLPKNEIVAGISGLYYVEEKDLLLLTASEEATASTTADGAIGESYLGGIKNFSKQLNAKEFKPDFYYKLSEADKAFSKQKIESVCMEKVQNNVLTLHFAADNDNGKSRLFKVHLRAD